MQGEKRKIDQRAHGIYGGIKEKLIIFFEGDINKQNSTI